ncbi:hypothetical protein GTR04_4857 [Trichophyton interdigitale]|nr:hypothetical protein GY631_4638 [Trichophyton interdigitale]KAG5216841.1 hypothetical protein GY632_7151 [Trichophyton interdigitale]KAG8207752.1 hypothetical protein GTR04_4857 [Trichophyton interdigitale]
MASTISVTACSIPADAKNRPALWIPDDRPGQNGTLDRHRRKRRLVRSIRLNAAGLRDVLLFMHENRVGNNISWTEEFVFKFVPKTFEGAIVTKSVAASVLRDSIAPSCFAIFPSAHTESIGLTGSPERLVHDIYWDGAEPVVPPELRDLPNLALIQQTRQYTI